MVEFQIISGGISDISPLSSSLDQRYELLAQLNAPTAPTNLRKDGSNAWATFRTFGDATEFVEDFLLFHGAIANRSLAGQVVYPSYAASSSAWGKPIEIKIPLQILNTKVLREIPNQQQTRGALARTALVQRPKM